MAALDYAVSSGAVTPGGERDDPNQTEPPLKGKGRRRLLRKLQRISSSPSLHGIRRSKSVGTPYASRSSLSCVSLAPAGPPPAPPPGFTTARQQSPAGLPTVPASALPSPSEPSPPHRRDCDAVAVRKVDLNDDARGVRPATAPLPTDLRSSPPEARARARAQSAAKQPPPQPVFLRWGDMPHELVVRVLSFLKPKELVRASRVCKLFYSFCHDGQLWTSFDASDFYREIPAESLARILVAAGPFVRHLNLRGCVQVEHYKRMEAIVKACTNLLHATFEGCRNFQRPTLHSLLEANRSLVHLNLTGLSAVTNDSCAIIARSCPQLEALNISWCDKVDAPGIQAVVGSCANLRDLRAGEVRGFDDLDVAAAIFRTNTLERLVLCGCVELTDKALTVMLRGPRPKVDILDGRPLVPPRKLRHLDLSRCIHLSSAGVVSLAHVAPDLQGLQLTLCRALTDAALEPILASASRLTHLELEGLEDISNALLADHLAKAPCVATLEHLSLSYCEHVSDVGMLPVMHACLRLRSVDLDNTRVSDLVLAEAAAMVTKRSRRSPDPSVRPAMTLQLAVYDCQNVTWTGIREVLFRNAQALPHPHGAGVTYPTEIIGLKCYYGFQMTVNEHQKRLLRGNLASANRLERKWAEYMQAVEEAGVPGSGHRSRMRRVREAHAHHMDEEGGGGGGGIVGRRRARTLGSCSVM